MNKLLTYDNLVYITHFADSTMNYYKNNSTIEDQSYIESSKQDSQKSLNLNKTQSDYTVNEALLKIREFKFIHEKVGIQPIYILYLLVLLALILVIGIYDDWITCLISILYPIYFSIKSLQYKNRERVRFWLSYWIVFALFINIETFFGIWLRQIELYFFYKIIFLLICYLPEYEGAYYLYEILIRDFFNKYEKYMYNFSVGVYKIVTKNWTDEKKEDDQDEDKQVEDPNSSRAYFGINDSAIIKE